MCTQGTAGAAAARMPGIDVARGLAVLGMVLANFRAKTGAVAGDAEWLMAAASRLEGKAAALFVVLAGVGISLRSARARSSGALRQERIALLDRAAVLFVLGLVLLHVWTYDILHMYGLFLALAAAFLGVSNRALWGLVLIFVGGGIVLQGRLDWWAPTDRWTWAGATSKLLFNGNYPLFPWMGFLLIGMWLGRLDLRRVRVRRPILMVSLMLWAIGVALDESVRAAMAEAEVSPWMEWARAFPRPARPGFVVVGAAGAVAMVCLCIAITDPRAERPWVQALSSTGQLAFTLYVAHTVAILIPLEHGVLKGAPLAAVTAFGMGFFALSIGAAVWWRRRWSHGPLEGLIRQFTGRRNAEGPWSGPLTGVRGPTRAASVACVAPADGRR